MVWMPLQYQQLLLLGVFDVDGWPVKCSTSGSCPKALDVSKTITLAALSLSPFQSSCGGLTLCCGGVALVMLGHGSWFRQISDRFYSIWCCFSTQLYFLSQVGIAVAFFAMSLLSPSASALVGSTPCWLISLYPVVPSSAGKVCLLDFQGAL